MNKQLRLFTSSLIFLFFGFYASIMKAFSVPPIGTEISYRHIDTLTYEVKYVFYRYCGHTALNNPNPNAKVVCTTSGSSAELTLTRKSISEVKMFCDSWTPQCNPPNSRAGDGIERQIYLDTVDFRKVPYNKLLSSGCTDLRFEYGGCCRTYAKGSLTGNIYNLATLNLKYGEINSSPEFNYDPFHYVRKGKPLYKNLSAVDTNDHDFVSYKIVQPWEGYMDSLYAGVTPIEAYYPSGLSHPYSNPNATPPIGFYFDTLTGDLVLTPDRAKESTILCVEAREWRQDTSGNLHLIGTTRRDFWVRVEQLANNTPIIVSASGYDLCEEEQFCFTFKTQDQAVDTFPPDTTKISWDGGIAGATFELSADTALNQSGKFCWTPPKGSSETGPHRFKVSTIDNACPLNEISVRTITLNVRKVAKTKHSTDSLGCGVYALSTQPDTILKSPGFEWAVLDTAGNRIQDTKKLKFDLSSGTISLYDSDTLHFYEPGTYVLRHTVSKATFCSKSYYDTLVITNADVRPLVRMPSDTTLCYDADNLNLRHIEDSTTPGGRWYCPKVTSAVVDDSIFIASAVGSTVSTTRTEVYYERTNAAGLCPRVDSFQITVNPLPAVNLADKTFCQDVDTVYLKNDVVVQPGGASIALGRQAWTCVDCGTYNAGALIKDIGTGGMGAPQNFVLHIDKSSMPLGSNDQASIDIELEFTNAHGCANRDTAKITVLKVPEIHTSGFPTLCWDEGTVDLKSISGVTPNDNKGVWKAIDSSGYAAAIDLNKGITGDQLNTVKSARPAQGNQRTYFMRYTYLGASCSATMNTTLTIRGLPEPRINRDKLAIHGSQEPYALCVTQSAISLNTDYFGGTWSSTEPNLLTGNVLEASNANKFNTPFKIFYHFTDIYGCAGSDSVEVEIHAMHVLNIPGDTLMTWWADTMNIDVKGSYFNSSGMTWIPLTGGAVSDSASTTTNFRFEAGKDTITRHLLHARTNEGSGGVCPHVEKTMVITIHPDPCVEYDIDYNLSNKEMKLATSNSLMQSYYWEVGDTIARTQNTVIDASSLQDSIVWVHLITVNQLGDSCEAYTKINLKTGSIRDVNRRLFIYPNPVDDHFVLETDLIGTKHIRVYDAAGRVAKELTIMGDEVDCHELTTGVYTLMIAHDGIVYYSRFVKR